MTTTESETETDLTYSMLRLESRSYGVFSWIILAQQLTMMYPDKVNSLTLVGSSCGGKDHTPKTPEFIKLQSEVAWLAA
jgi:hypothetical protein